MSLPPGGAPPLRVALLPTGLFPNGHAQFVSQIPARSGITPLAVHNTYQYRCRGPIHFNLPSQAQFNFVPPQTLRSFVTSA